MLNVSTGIDRVVSFLLRSTFFVKAELKLYLKYFSFFLIDEFFLYQNKDPFPFWPFKDTDMHLHS